MSKKGNPGNSQYIRAAETPVFVNQKSMMLSSTSSRVRSVGCPSKAREISSSHQKIKIKNKKELMYLLF